MQLSQATRFMCNLGDLTGIGLVMSYIVEHPHPSEVTCRMVLLDEVPSKRYDPTR